MPDVKLLVLEGREDAKVLEGLAGLDVESGTQRERCTERLVVAELQRLSRAAGVMLSKGRTKLSMGQRE